MEISDDASVVMPVFQELKKNFKRRGTKPFSFRKAALSRLLEGYKELRQQISEAQEKDLGMTPFMSEMSTHGLTLGQIQAIKDNFEKWAKPHGVESPVILTLASSEIKYEPLGVVLVISAWNYPIYTCIPPLAAAIAAGNCVIVKPSEHAPHTSNVIKKLFQNYLDPRFYQCIEGKVEVAKAVTRLPLDLICFTGSTMTGRLVAMEAAKNITPCILELGGKCPTIVDETANIQSAVYKVMMGKYLNCGQTCVGVDHVYVHESVYGKFKKILLEKMQNAYGTKKLLVKSDYGKIVNSIRVNRLDELLNDEHGGEVIFGGEVNKDQLFIYPTLVEKPSKKSLMMSEQIFGPIMPIFPYSDINSLIDEINDQPKPLAVYLFSENKASIELVKENTFSGAFSVNQTLTHMANTNLPFGGVGKSGYGRYHGESGFIAFSNPKSICHTSSLNVYPLTSRFPPYKDSDKSTIVTLLKFGHTSYSAIYRWVFVALFVVFLVMGLSMVVMPRIK